MIDAGGSGAGAALGGAIAGRASGQAPSSVLAAKVDGANQKAGGLGGNQKKLCPTCPCPPETLKANILNCGGSKGIWNQAKAATGRTPQMTVGPASGGFAGDSNSHGKVTIAPNHNCCVATQYVVFELTNVASTPRFDDLDKKAAAGDLGREDYALGNERIEYDGVRSNANTFNSCKKAWGCDEKATAAYGSVNQLQNFNDYMQYVDPSHTDSYRDYWDAHYQGAYDGKHP